MIRDVKTRRRKPAITSDRWHVVHASWTGNDQGDPLFDRKILSEHADWEAARSAALEVRAALTADMNARPRERRDQVFVRKPNFKSLKISVRPKNRPKTAD